MLYGNGERESLGPYFGKEEDEEVISFLLSLVLDSFDESYVFDLPTHCIGVSNPPTRFKIMPNAIYGSADCKELQNQFNYVRRKCNAFWNSIHDSASDD